MIPTKPLELEYEVNDLTLEDVAIFALEDAAQANFVYVNQVRKFLLKYAKSWSASEVNNITIGELADIAPQLIDALNQASVPKAPLPR